MAKCTTEDKKAFTVRLTPELADLFEQFVKESGRKKGVFVEMIITSCLLISAITNKDKALVQEILAATDYDLRGGVMSFIKKLTQSQFIELEQFTTGQQHHEPDFNTDIADFINNTADNGAGKHINKHLHLF
jgi:hypothetical protein